jgi:hypothetical protein
MITTSTAAITNKEGRRRKSNQAMAVKSQQYRNYYIKCLFCDSISICSIFVCIFMLSSYSRFLLLLPPRNLRNNDFNSHSCCLHLFMSSSSSLYYYAVSIRFRFGALFREKLLSFYDQFDYVDELMFIEVFWDFSLCKAS